jgi:N-acetylmuramoyl-L-alanine amidase
MDRKSLVLLERFLLALCVWREARSESIRGKQLVANVVINRVHDKRWPNTVRDVVLQPYQFSSFNRTDGNAVLFPHDDPAWDECVQSADIAAIGPAMTTANHYHVRGLDPQWRVTERIVAVEGRHIFYTL